MKALDFEKKLESLLGKKNCLFETKNLNKYFQNIYGKPHNSTGVVFPKTDSDVQEIIRLARKFKVALYPLSTGKNFGLGSNLPVRKSHLVVDLKRMNKILEFSNDLGVIRIQPGVTQKQVHEFLLARKSKFELNVTGSASGSSVIGNLLERGIGHFGPRSNDLLSLKAVLGTGTPLYTGAGVYSSGAKKLLNRHGIGADLTQLFLQSTLGIVTEATLRLRPSSEETTIFSFENAKSEKLSQFIDHLMKLRQRNLLPSNLHISNRNRSLSVLTPLIARESGSPFHLAQKMAEKKIKSAWTASSTLGSTTRIADTATKEIKVGKGRLKFKAQSLTELLKMDDLLSRSVRGTLLHTKGVPCSDAILSLGFGQGEMITEKPEISNTGALFLVPVLPATGQDVEKAIEIIERRFSAEKFRSYITLNLIDDLFFEAVVNLTFDKRDLNQVKRAHRIVLKTFKELNSAGFPPQRLSIFQMPHFEGVVSSHLKAVENLKNIFDPDSILSDGRYDFRGMR